MRYLLLLNIFLTFWSKYNHIAQVNAIKEEAAAQYQKKQYLKSIQLYEKLLTEYKEKDETIKLNLANAYFLLKRYNSAIDNYKMLTLSKQPAIKSIAYLQLGVIYSNNHRKEIGLSYFKEALKAQPENEAARYNYELLKKEQEKGQPENSTEKKRENINGEHHTSASDSEEAKKNDSEKNQQNNPSDQNEEEHFDEDDGNSDGEDEGFQLNTHGTNETDALTSQRLEELHMNERQARMILKTMKSNEIQYLQQRHKVIHTKPIPGKPDW